MQELLAKWRSGELPRATIVFIALNLLVYITMELIGSTQDADFSYQCGALFAPAVLEEGEYWRLLTAAFIHFGASHIMNNILVLYVIGQRLEPAVGSIRFALIYLISAIGANYVSALYYAAKDPYILSAGASGAVMGIIGALFARIILHRGRLGDLDRRQMIILILFSLYSGYAVGNTNNIAHFSGLIFGFLLGLIP